MLNIHTDNTPSIESCEVPRESLLAASIECTNRQPIIMAGKRLHPIRLLLNKCSSLLRQRGRFCIGLILITLTFAGWSRTSSFRFVALSGMAMLYDVYDPLSIEVPVNFGPRCETCLTYFADRESQSAQLTTWFPQFAFDVRSQESEPCLSQPPFFQHEVLSAFELNEFRALAGDSLLATGSLFDLSTKVRGLTEHGISRADLTGTDITRILRHAKHGDLISCRHFALIFGECAVLNGYTTRLIGLSENGTHFDHAVVEVYAPEFGKWILVDPDFNVAYRRHGEWLSAAELHDIWIDMRSRFASDAIDAKDLQLVMAANRNKIQQLTQLELVCLGNEAESLRESNLRAIGTGLGLRFYEYVIYTTRNNFLTGYYPKGHRKRSFQYVLMATDNKALPSICPEGELVRSRRDLYFPVGRCRIDPKRRIDDKHIELCLSTWTPNFERFEVRMNDAEWQPQTSNVISIPITLGETVVEARSVNAGGLRGEPTRFVIDVTSAVDHVHE